MAVFGLRLLRLRTLVILPAIMILWLNASVAFAGPLGLPLEPVTQTVNSLGLPVQLGSSASGLPTVAPIDLNPLLDQIVDPVVPDVNSLGLVQLPPVELPPVPVIPGVDAERIVGRTVTDINNAVPLPVPVPNPIDLLLAPGGTTIPLLPGTELTLPPLLGGGGTGGGLPPQPPADTLEDLTNLLTLAGRLPDGTVVPEQRAAVGAAIILAARLDASIVAANLRSSDLMKPAPAGTSDSAYDFSDMSTGLALVPFLGLLCAVMALLAYLRSGQHLWRARA